MATNTHVAMCATSNTTTFDIRDGWEVTTTATLNAQKREDAHEWEAFYELKAAQKREAAVTAPVNVQLDETTATRPLKAQSKPHKCKGTQPTPAWDNLLPGEPKKYRHRTGWIAIINSEGEVILDCHAAYPREDGVRKLRTPPEFGVTHKDLMFANGAMPACRVEALVKQITANRTVILHGGTHDLTVFVIEKDVYAKSKVVDTQRMYSYLQNDGTPGLRTTAEEILKISVQEMGHSTVEDAQTTLKLWKLTNTYDRVAEVAKLQASKGKKTTGAQPNNQNQSCSQNRGRRNQPQVVQQVTTQVVVQQDPPPDTMDGNSFPPLGSMGRKRR